MCNSDPYRKADNLDKLRELAAVKREAEVLYELYRIQADAKNFRSLEDAKVAIDKLRAVCEKAELYGLLERSDGR
jgi:hypothetical protein